MSDWTKSEDWIPYTNALAQVNYYLQTIKSTERSLAIMDMMGVPKSDRGYQLTIEELDRKHELLDVARFKLKRSWKRITESDKQTWADKIPF